MCPESLQVISGKPPVLQELEANTPAPRSQQLRVGQYLGLTREKQLLTGRRSFVFRWVLDGFRRIRENTTPTKPGNKGPRREKKESWKRT